MILTDERKTAIREYLRTGRIQRSDLSGVLIDPEVPKEFLTAEMISDLSNLTRRAKRTGKFKAHRVARSKEEWRVMTNYPQYEISSYGRVRSLLRTQPTDWLKPRWFRGQQSVVLYDKDGIRRERGIYWLMVNAGWLASPKPKTSSAEV